MRINPFINISQNLNGSKNRQNRRCSFGATARFNDGTIDYIIDYDDKNTENPLSVKKDFKGQVLKAKLSIVDFCRTLHRIGLLSEFLPLYRKYRSLDLTSVLAGINRKLKKDELEAYLDLLKAPDKNVISYYLPTNSIIDSVRNEKEGKLTVGEIKKLLPKDIAQISSHFNKFGISHVSGCISGLHNLETYNRLFEAAAKRINRKVNVSKIIAPDDKNIKIIAIMDKSSPDTVSLFISHKDELYTKRLPHSEDMRCKDFVIERYENEKGENTFRFYYSMPVSDDENDPIRKNYEKLFAQYDKYKKVINPWGEYTLFKIGGVKFKTTFLNDKNHNPNEIYSCIEGGGMVSEGFSQRIIKDGKTKYYYNALVYNPIKLILNNLEKRADDKFAKFISSFLAQNSEDDFWRIMFSVLTSKEGGRIQRVSPDKMVFKFDKNIFEQKKAVQCVDRDLYIIKRENLPNGMSIFRYQYGYSNGNNIIKKTKTVVSKEIMDKVMKRISGENFKSAYSIDKSGKILSYFKFNDIYFKLILAETSIPTCFPMTIEDLKQEIGENYKSIPNLE